MENSRGIRSNKYFKTLSTFVTSLFLFTTIIDGMPSNSLSLAKADTIDSTDVGGSSEGKGKYKEINVDWTRTKDVREGGSFSVHNSDKKFDKYWIKDGNTYTMKSYDDIDDNGTDGVDAKKGEEGILLMQQLFTGDKKTVVFDYDSLTKTMGASDTNVWDGKGNNPYATYRHDVVNGYLATKDGDYYQLVDVQNSKNPTTNIKKESDLTADTYPEFATWQYMKYPNQQTKGYDQMRLFNGNYTIDEGDLDKYNYYITTGNNKDNILAIDDTLMVLVDGMPTDINYTTANYTNTTVKLKNGSTTYPMNFNQTLNCRVENQLPVTSDLNTPEGNRNASLSVFTDTLHVDLAKEIQNSINGSKVLGDITENMKAKGGTSHKVQVIASDYNLSGGMTKLNIIRTPKPDTSLVKDAYVGDKLVASSSDGSSSNVKPDDNITYKFTYKNNGEAPVYNILFEDDLLNATIGMKDGVNTFSVNGSTYTAADFSVTKYASDGSLVKSGDGSMLADKNMALSKGEYIVVSSDKLAHKPTSTEVTKGKVENTVTTTSVYQGYYKEVKVTDKAEAKVTVKISEEDPHINVVKEAYGDKDYSKLIASSDPAQNKNTADIAKGQTAYYKFIITNNGDTDLTKINVKDSDLNITASGSDYSPEDLKSLVIEKYDAGNKKLNESGLSALNSLKKGEKIVIYDNAHIIKTDITKSFKNTVKATGTTPSGNDVTDNASVTVVPKDPVIEVTKTAFTNVATKAAVTNVAAGEKVYYKFTAQNTGDTDLVNVTFKDPNFNGKDSIVVTKDGITINGKEVDSANTEVVKYDASGKQIEKGSLELLSSLKVGERITFTNINELFRQTSVEDVNKQLSNTVTGYGTYEGPGGDKTVEDKDTVVVTPSVQKITVTKTASKLDVNSETGKTQVASSEKPELSTKVKRGTTVYYTLGLENNGPYKMNNITFDDTTLNIQISSNGIVKNGKTVDSAGTKVVKYQVNSKDSTIKEGGLELLNEELLPGWKVEVSNDNYLNDNKDTNNQITNEVFGKGQYKITDGGDPKDTDKVKADVTVPVYDPDDVNPSTTVTKIKAEKQAIEAGSKKVVADSEDASKTEKIVVGKTLDYKIVAINTGNEILKNINFEDVDLSLKISGSEVTKNGAKVSDSKSMIVNKFKINDDGSKDLEVSGSFKDLASILAELKPNESIEIEDNLLLNYITNQPGIVNNTVIVKGYGESKDPTDNAKVQVPVIDSDVDITKDVYKIIGSDGTVKYDKTKDTIDPLKVRIYPEDKVQYAYKITNNTEKEVDKLHITDILENPDMEEFKNVTDWTFTYLNDGQAFNKDDFKLGAKESIDILSNVWTVPDNCKRNVINTVNLYQKQDDGTDKFKNKDDAKVIVYPRVYVNMDCPSDTNKEFYVTVKGDNGFETSMYIKDKDKVEISDYLDFDVKYTVTETIPMNFTYNGIDIEKGTDISGNKKDPKELTFDLMTVKHPENITLHNEKRNSDEFQDDSEKTNTLVYKEK